MKRVSIVNIVRNVRQTHPYDVALVKFGKFYHAYGKDAYVISYIFNYQVKKVEMNTYTAGFSETSFEKVIKLLEDKSVNYLILDKSVNYNIVYMRDFGEKNNYATIYNQAYKFISLKNNVDSIYEYLISNINEKMIIEKYINLKKC